jgi:uncharacterized protein (TIGR02300 family)
MTKPQLGTKHLCAHCGAKFYDLHRSPITCPKCGTIFDVVQVGSRSRTEARVEPVSKGKPREVQFVSLQDGDAPVKGEQRPSEPPEVQDEVEPADETLDDAGLIEEREQEDGDVAEIMDGNTDIEERD